MIASTSVPGGEYADFLAHKRLIDPPTGIDHPATLPAFLFPHQRDIVRWALRKPGDNPRRIAHGTNYPVDRWQRVASPVWDDINPSDTLQFRAARDENDERHIAPLQLEVIRRCVELWSAPQDVVLTPFAGIGSEVYVAAEMGRKAVGVELKPTYFEQAKRNLEFLDAHRGGDLFQGAAE